MSISLQRQARFNEVASMSDADLARTQGGVLPVALAVAYAGAITSGLIAGVTGVTRLSWRVG